MRYFYAAQKEHFDPDIPLIIVRDVEEIKAQKNKRENMIPDMFDFMRWFYLIDFVGVSL